MNLVSLSQDIQVFTRLISKAYPEDRFEVETLTVRDNVKPLL
jgi:hypothetical protein